MAIKQVAGPNDKRQYYEITKVYTGKKAIVSVKKENADTFEKLRNKYENEHIDGKGKRSIIAQKVKAYSTIGGALGLITGGTASILWQKSWGLKTLTTLAFGTMGALLGADIADHKNMIIKRKLFKISKNEYLMKPSQLNPESPSTL